MDDEIATADCVVTALLLVARGDAAAAQNRSEDEYTRYELLAPETASFKIIYDVTAVSPGAKFFFNPIRTGSVATDESVIDLMTGAPLKFQEVSGAEARDSGLTNASLEGRYIRVELARPVPQGGEGRIRIIKTYKDPKSYFRDGDGDRVRSPARHQAQRRRPSARLRAACRATFPSQVIEEADGRVGISFMNTYPAQAPLVLRAAALVPQPKSAAKPLLSSPTPRHATCRRSGAGRCRRWSASRVSERAFQDREIVYFLKSPETHAFSLYHDYTETREGIDQLRQRRARRQHRVGSVGEDPRHRRGAEDRDAERARPSRRPRSTSASRCGPTRKSC